jgi:sugar phosphate isomerase/epimerase
LNIFISSKIKRDFKEAVSIVEKLEANLEICGFADSLILDGEFEETLEHYAGILKNFSGKRALHGTFYDLNPVSKDPKIREITDYRYNQTLHTAEMLGVGTVVFHTCYNDFHSEDYREKFIDRISSFWEKNIKKFENSDITVVLENVYEEDPEFILSILGNVNSPNLKVCIDIGHLNILPNKTVDINEWISQTGKYLHHMHLHNNSGVFDEHNSLLNGTICVESILSHLKATNLSPNLSLEIFNESHALESYEFVQKFISSVHI